MKILTVKRGETTYSLYNLTPQRFLELKNDPNELRSYFNHCYRTKMNICVQVINENPSTSAASPMHQHVPLNSPSEDIKFTFLCSHFSNKDFIYAIKLGKQSWHYFDIKDSVSSEHGSLPASIEALIRGANKPTPINVNLNKEQAKNYYVEGKFIFKNKALKTSMEINSSGNQSISKSDKTTNRLIFVSGQSNPSLFLNDYEKCTDLKNDQDKMYEIRQFVDDSHKAEFIWLFFNSDWQTVRFVFLKLYSKSFVTNKKRELQIEFNKSKSLRSFVERKLTSLSTYTTLPFNNQVEMVMNDLPPEISLLFITNEKMTSNKANILEFCDSIQDLVSTMRREPEASVTINLESGQKSSDLESRQLNRMEIVESEQSDSMQIDDEEQSSRGGPSRSTGVRQPVRSPIVGVIAKRGRGRPRKETIVSRMANIQEDSSDYDFMRQVDDSSRSSSSAF